MNSGQEKPLEQSVTERFADEQFIEELRAQMLAFAKLQIRDEGLAEDAVQEALIGALKNAESFGRRAALKTWVFAILKNKIVDQLRKLNRELPEASFSSAEDEHSNLDELFDNKGFWLHEERPVKWNQPRESLEQEQFWQVFELCLEGLPENQARLFMMREFLEVDCEEICDLMNISSSNLYVILYRARFRLRECLENRWFSGEQA